LDPTPKVYRRVLACSRPPMLGQGIFGLDDGRYDTVGSVGAVSTSHGVRVAMWDSDLLRNPVLPGEQVKRGSHDGRLTLEKQQLRSQRGYAPPSFV
jgi:hypothetical protein